MSDWDILTGSVERDRRNVAVLMESVAELYGPRDLDELTRGAVDRALLVTGAERGILLLGDSGEMAPTVARSRGEKDLPLDLAYPRSVVRRVEDTREAYRTVNTPQDQELGHSIIALQLLSIMATPLTVQGQMLGILYVDSTFQVKEFTSADFAVFQALGGMIALAVENGRLLDERVKKERLEADMGNARSIQQRLLPKDWSTPPGFDIAGAGRSCEETSGDYYDVIPLPDGNIALIVGDVKGHGLPAAFYMASARALLHGLLQRSTDPVEILDALNRFLDRDMRSDDFMTFFLGVLDVESRTLLYASAGHNPPLLVRSAGDDDELGNTGPPLAVMPAADYGPPKSRPLATGDTLFLYTDGIFEARNAEDEIWGEELFHASVHRHAKEGETAEAVMRGVLADLDAFIDGWPLEDDVTCVVVRAL